MHHDGGLEERLHRIDGALAAADPVACQAGCIRQYADWRVKENAKHTTSPASSCAAAFPDSAGCLAKAWARTANASVVDTHSHFDRITQNLHGFIAMTELIAPPPQPAVPPSLPPRIDSRQLLGGAQSIEIEHAGQRYLLRVTRENKLILTK